MKIFLTVVFFLFFTNTVFANKNCLPVIDKDLNKAKDYNYVIISGVLNEILFNYMTWHKTYLLDLGVNDSQIKRIDNFSISVPEASSLKIKRIVESFKNKKKVIIISHSKGALESLYMMVKYKDVRDKLHKVVLIQGPLQGVSSYDLTYELPGEKIAEKSWFFRFYRWTAQSSFISLRFKNFSKVNVIKYFNYKILKSENILDKLIFIRTYKEIKDMNLRFRYIGGLYKDYLNEKSDGVILFKEQAPFGVTKENSCLIDFYADHGDFVKTSLIGNAKRKKKIKSFLDHILFNKEMPKEFIL